MEFYDKANGIQGAGGLGVLAADTRRIAEELGVPLVTMTPFYLEEVHQVIKNNQSTITVKNVKPNNFDFHHVGYETLNIAGEKPRKLSLYLKELGSTKILSVTEEQLKGLYTSDGGSDGDPRLYQNVANGFGGYRGMRKLGLKPAVMQLNESATAFAALARLDSLVEKGKPLNKAITYLKKHTLYTNHTLIQAAESEFGLSQFEKYVFPNLTSPAVETWLRGLFRENKLRLNTICMELTGLRNGVSKLHAKVADYHELDGKKVNFKAITNGIDLPTWLHPRILDVYLGKDILDDSYLPTWRYKRNIKKLTNEDIKDLKRKGREELNKVLQKRKNHLGKTVEIPKDAIVFDFKRRFVSYKRPDLPFTDVGRLKKILQKHDAYYLFAGRVYEDDTEMAKRLHDVLNKAAADEFLRERIHYFPDYDEELGRALAIGSDVAVNTPIVGLEACGTSFMKDIGNLKLLISTIDGGVADLRPAPVLQVTGRDEAEELESLYGKMERAGEILRNERALAGQVHKQLMGYLPIICGGRMMDDYLRYFFKR
jgi:starch phosphorylase